MLSTVASTDFSADASARDRRTHERLAPGELAWIREVRLKYGPRVSLIDLSTGGALLQTDVRLRPGTDMVIEIVGSRIAAVPIRVLRSQLARITGDTAIYQGACEFKRPFDLEKARAVLAPADRGDVGLRKLMLRRRPEGSQMPDWQFRLLQAGGYLLEMLPTGSGAQEALLQETVAATDAATPAPDAVVGWQKIVVRYREGRLLKGFTHDFHPSRTQFTLWPAINSAPSDRMYVPTSQLKAVFFVRDFNGNPDYRDARSFDGHTAGRRLEVTFADDEVLLGSTLNYRPDGVGFFLNPADAGGNNLRVFVVGSAIRHVRFL